MLHVLLRNWNIQSYCLTTIIRNPQKAGLPSVFNGFRKVQRSWLFSLKTVQPLKTQHFISYCLKTPTLWVARSNRVGRTIKISTPTGVDIFIVRHDEKFIPRRGKSCRAYQMQEIRTYSSLWEMCSDFFFLMALFLVEMHSAAALWQLKKEV